MNVPALRVQEVKSYIGKSKVNEAFYTVRFHDNCLQKDKSQITEL